MNKLQHAREFVVRFRTDGMGARQGAYRVI